MTGYKGRFKVMWWRWYLVDVTNWHRPVIIRKHFDNKEQASDYRKRYFNNEEYDLIIGHEAMELQLRDWVSIRHKNHHPTRDAPKYVYPDWCKTQRQRQTFRLRTQKKKLFMKNLPDITPKDIFYILRKKPIQFVLNTKRFKNWHYAYSEPTKNLLHYIEIYKWPEIVSVLALIEKTLKHFNYDIGPWPIKHIVVRIYDKYGDMIRKFRTGISLDHEKAVLEFKARGFVPRGYIKPTGFREDCYIGSNTQADNLYWPQPGNIMAPDSEDDKRILIYTLQGLVGVPGFTKCYLPRKYDY